jgi:propanol-preferring alcohol dehydrogenase
MKAVTEAAMKATMKAMVLHAHGPIESAPLRLEEWPAPEPGEGEVRLRVHCCAICRTDLHVIEGDLPPLRLPLVPGHQAVGVVDKLGPGCSVLREGDRVGVAWLRHTCGRCAQCRAGRENLCEASRFTGYQEHGGYAERAIVPEAFAYRIPAAFDDVAATPLLCAGIIGYRALKRSQLPAGGSLGIYGFGSSAHVVLQIARHRGCRVYVVSRGGRHLEHARQMGADWVGSAGEPLPEPVDSAIVFAPAGEVVPQALAALKKGGTLALAGIYMTQIPPLDYQAHLFYERNVHSVTANTREDGRELLAEAARIPIRPHTTTYPLAEANRALRELKADRIQGTGVLVMK